MSQLEDCYKGILKYNVNYKPFPDLVRAFWEFSDENDFLYDYSGNGFDLTSNGVLYTKNGAYFNTNTSEVTNRTLFQEDLRRLQIKGSKLTELLSPINDEFSISFDFTPLENESTLFELRNDTANSNTNIIRARLLLLQQLL